MMSVLDAVVLELSFWGCRFGNIVWVCGGEAFFLWPIVLAIHGLSLSLRMILCILQYCEYTDYTEYSDYTQSNNNPSER